MSTPHAPQNMFAISARFMQDEYEVRTDGVLLYGNRTLQAILEVKPRCHDRLQPHVQLQKWWTTRLSDISHGS
jgi:hypothetical protein